jgi:purine-binding chemotaxis protein CheW
MSLSSKLGVPEADLTPKARIIIVRPEQQAAPVGLIVEEVKEVITLEQDDIEKMNYDGKDDKGNFSIGVGKFGTDLINLLNISSIVLDKEATV